VQETNGTSRTEVQDAPRSLGDLAARIRAEHQAASDALKASVHHAIACGTLLLEAKKEVEHGEWLDWLNANCDIPERTVQAYMRLARLPVEKRNAVADLPLRDALSAIRSREQQVADAKERENEPTGRPTIAVVADDGTVLTGVEALRYKSSLPATPPPAPATEDEIADDHMQQLAEAVAAGPPVSIQALHAAFNRRFPPSVQSTLVAKGGRAAFAPVKITSPLVTPVYDVGRSRAFCGPTAMSAVTGEPISVVRDAVRQASGKIHKSDGSAWPVMGMHNADLVAAMRLLGWRVAEEWHEPEGGKPYTLDSFAKDRGHDGPFIVAVTGHYVAISQGEFCDTITELPKDLSVDVPNRPGAWVRSWWRFEKDVSAAQSANATRDTREIDDGSIPTFLRREPPAREQPASEAAR
jgi:Protein of unknown function (DUF3102)